jgi:cytoskeletal protein CcmA (bactofilin family)
MQKRFLILVLLLVGGLAPGMAWAYGGQSGQNLTLPKGETRSGTYYATGQTVTIDGDINGDLICAGSTVSVNGAVHGDVICAGQLVSVNGPVDGSVRLAGQSVSVNGSVGRNATVMTQALTIGNAAHISGDLGVLAQTASINGPVDQDVYGRVQSLSIAASVGAVNAWVQQLTLGSGAQVRGDVKYVSENTFELDKSKVGGKVERSAPPVNHNQRAAAATSAGFALRFYWIVAGLLTGLVLTWLLPRLFRRVTGVMLERPGAALGWGVLATLVAPVLAFVLLITVVGAPLGLFTLALWGMSMAVGGLFAGVAVGRWLLTHADWRPDSLVLAAAFGVPLAVILFSIPGLGALILVAATVWAVGGLLLSARGLR